MRKERLPVVVLDALDLETTYDVRFERKLDIAEEPMLRVYPRTLRRWHNTMKDFHKVQREIKRAMDKAGME